MGLYYTIGAIKANTDVIVALLILTILNISLTIFLIVTKFIGEKNDKQ